MDEEEADMFFMGLIAASVYFYQQITQLQSIYLKQVAQRSSMALVPYEERNKHPGRLREPRTIILTRKTFNNLCMLLGPRMASNTDGTGVGRPHTSIEKQILPVLWLLATPDSYRSVSDRFDISKGTLFLFFNRLVEALNSIGDLYITWPTPGEMPLIRKQFYKMAQFDEWVIGSVDGTYVPIPAPKVDAHVYRIRKNNFAVTLQGICIPSLHFIDCFVGFPGSVHDKRIFENSPIYKKILRDRHRYFPSNEYIIGDKAYPVFEWCQVPYVRRGILSEAQEYYNHRLSATRQVIERSFALLFGRFRRLKFLDMSREDLIPNTVFACCVLHNICIAEMDFNDFIIEGLEHVRENNAVSETSPSNQLNTTGDRRRGEVTARIHSQYLASNIRQSSTNIPAWSAAV